VPKVRKNIIMRYKELVIKSVSPNLHAAFKARCCREGHSMKGVIEALMSRYAQVGAEGAKIFPDKRSNNGSCKAASKEYDPKNDPYSG